MIRCGRGPSPGPPQPQGGRHQGDCCGVESGQDIEVADLLGRQGEVGGDGGDPVAQGGVEDDLGRAAVKRAMRPRWRVRKKRAATVTSRMR